MSLRKATALCVALALVCVIGVRAQLVRQQTVRDLTQLETIVRMRGDDIWLMGKGYLWDGLERLLLERLRARVRVRVLTGERDAPMFAALARAGAEVRTLPGGITQGPMLAGPVLVNRVRTGEFVVIEADANAIIRARLSEMYASSLTKPYTGR